MTRGPRTRSILVACGSLWLAAGGWAAESAGDWPRLPPLPGGAFVVLADGGILAGDLLALDDHSMTIDSPGCGAVAVPRSAVSGYRTSRAVPPRASAGRAAAADDAAIIMMANGDAVRVTALAARDGVVRFSTTQRPAAAVTMPMSRLLAIDFPARAKPSPGPWVVLRDGSRLPRASLPAACGENEIVAAAAAAGDAQLLVALPADAAGDPVSTQAWPTVRGLTSFTAIAMHAPARVVYRLAKPAAGFAAIVAIDDSAGQGGSVVVRVRGRTGDGAFREAFTSPIIRGGEEPLAIAADLDGATELELVVEEADVGAVLDRTIWLDPRVTR